MWAAAGKRSVISHNYLFMMRDVKKVFIVFNERESWKMRGSFEAMLSIF
jgi:hypothetical protein